MFWWFFEILIKSCCLFDVVELFLLSLKEFLPKEYIKNKGEKKIFQVRESVEV